MSGTGAFQVSGELLLDVLHLPADTEIVAASWGTVGEFGVGGPPCLTLYVRHPSIGDAQGIVKCYPIATREADGTVRVDLNPEVRA